MTRRALLAGLLVVLVAVTFVSVSAVSLDNLDRRIRTDPEDIKKPSVVNDGSTDDGPDDGEGSTDGPTPKPEPDTAAAWNELLNAAENGAGEFVNYYTKADTLLRSSIGFKRVDVWVDRACHEKTTCCEPAEDGKCECKAGSGDTCLHDHTRREMRRRHGRKPIILLPGALGSQLDVTPKNEFKCPVEPGQRDGPEENVSHDRYDLKAGKTRIAWTSTLSNRHRDRCMVRTLWLDNTSEDGVCKPDEQFDVQVRKGFGNIKAVTTLSSNAVINMLGYANYLRKMARELRRGRYKCGKDLFAAPYDWRFSPTNPHQDPWFKFLFETIDKAYSQNNRKVVIFAHSYGNLMFLEFLRRAETGHPSVRELFGSTDPKEWLEQRIDRYLGAAPPYIGSPATYVHAIGGSDILSVSLSAVRRADLREVARRADSIPALSPVPAQASLWEEDNKDVLKGEAHIGVTIGDKKFRLGGEADGNGIDAALAAAGADEHACRMFRANTAVSVKAAIDPPELLRTTRIPMFIFHSEDIPTLLNVHYNASVGISDQDPQALSTMRGDGTVPTTSALYPTRWEGVKVKNLDYALGHPSTEVHPGHIHVRKLRGCDTPETCEHQQMVALSTDLLSSVLAHLVDHGDDDHQSSTSDNSLSPVDLDPSEQQQDVEDGNDKESGLSDTEIDNEIVDNDQAYELDN